MTDPLVSIIIPTYNRAHLIGETLDSVLVQTYENWECIIVDDGSTDNTSKLLESYVQKDSRFQYHHRPSNRLKGANACRNYGFELSKGDYIQWLDSDDLLAENKISDQILLLKGKDYRFISSCPWQNFETIADIKINYKQDLKVYHSYSELKKFIQDLSESGGFLPPHSYLCSRRLIHESGNWLEHLTINQDGEFFSRIFVRATGVLFCEHSKVYYRVASMTNVSILNSIEKADQAIESWKLIESLFKIRFGESTNLIAVSKKYLGLRILKTFPNSYISNQQFFEFGNISPNPKDRITIIKSFLKRISNQFFGN